MSIFVLLWGFGIPFFLVLFKATVRSVLFACVPVRLRNFRNERSVNSGKKRVHMYFEFTSDALQYTGINIQLQIQCSTDWNALV